MLGKNVREMVLFDSKQDWVSNKKVNRHQARIFYILPKKVNKKVESQYGPIHFLVGALSTFLVSQGY